MYNEINIHQRPILIDRLQVTVTPDFNVSREKLNIKSLNKALIENKKLKGYQYKCYKDKNKKLHYDIILPNFIDINYVKNIKISAFHPFAVSFQLNFTRLLKNKIRNLTCFRFDYDNEILLDSDNYINYETWPYWDNNTVYSLIQDLKHICIFIAEKAMYSLYPPHNIDYENVTVKQIEINIDYYVGCNNSFFIMDTFAGFINSNEGIDFRENLRETAIKQRLPFNIKIEEPTQINKNESYSIQFELYNGIFFKIYRKTKDHIRAELTFKSNVLRKKFKEKIIKNNGSTTYTESRKIDRIIKPVIEWSKSFFKNIDLTNIIFDITNKKSKIIIINQLQPLYEFFRNSIPEMNTIIDSIINGSPLKEQKAIDYIRKHPEYRQHFTRNYDYNGNWFYCYNPIESNRRRTEDIKNNYAKPLLTRTFDPRLPKEVLWKGNKMITIKK